MNASLFDGMSCGRLALERAGVKVDKYYASEVDKHAITVALKNYPDTVQLGDVQKVHASDLPQIDLLIGGSPCQGFSISGTHLNFDDPRSALFFEFVRLLQECRPRYFLLENVPMKAAWSGIISELLDVDAVKINSALVSAQHRRRLYWTNIKSVTQPVDRKIYLRDVIEPITEFRHNPETARMFRALRGPHQKAFALTATMWKGAQANGMTNIAGTSEQCSSL